MRIKKSISNAAYMLAGIWTTWTITSGHTMALGMSVIPMVVILGLCAFDSEDWNELRGGWFD